MRKGKDLEGCALIRTGNNFVRAEIQNPIQLTSIVRHQVRDYDKK